MEINKILAADFLDLVFDQRNKDYGAYDLRRTYNKRITRALLITFSIAGVIYTGSVLAGSGNTIDEKPWIAKVVTIDPLPEEEQIPEPLPEPEPEPPQQVRSEIYTEPVIMDDTQVDEPPPTMDDLALAKIGLVRSDGGFDEGITEPSLSDSKGVVEPKKMDDPDEPFMTVQIEAKFDGDWRKFLIKNLRGEVPVDNGAPAGRHTVYIQFVVDKDGTLSDIKPLTNIGFGMEEEAIRVIKKSVKWEPAVQNGHHVKAYRKQAVTFEVLTDE